MVTASEAPPLATPLVGTLRNHARFVERVLTGSAPVPPRWVAPPFVAHLERIRSHLRPIRSVDMLVSSYGREAWLMSARGRPVAGHDEQLDAPLELAYALRLIELDAGGDQTPWTTMVRRAAELRYGDSSDRQRIRLPLTAECPAADR